MNLIGILIALILLLSVWAGSTMLACKGLPRRRLSPGLDLLLLALLFSLCLGLLGRPIIAALCVGVFILLMAVVSRVKDAVLKEPIVFCDLALAKLALRHPALYIAYLGYGKFCLAVIVAFSTAGGLLWLEKPLWSGWAGEFLTILLVILTVFGFRLGWGRQALAALFRHPPLTGRIQEDLPQFGLLGSAFRYAIIAAAERPARQALYAPSIPTAATRPDLPTLIAVQAESFFDPRRLGSSLPADLLPNFDRLAAKGISGRLTVGGWGANTMRAEFSVLSGLPDHALGLDRYNPYFALARRPLDSLAWQAKRLGYRTLCLHPYSAHFFGRDSVYPNLGFDEFHDISRFENAPRHGPYVADPALADYVATLLANRREPLFLFLITMENHGPWKPGRIPAAPTLEKDLPGLALESSDFAAYLCHIRSGDTMLGDLAKLLETENRGGALMYYGDHLPSFPHLIAAAGITEPTTDYLLWQQGTPLSLRRDETAFSLNARFRSLWPQD
jgi:hypothetical protein